MHIEATVPVVSDSGAIVTSGEVVRTWPHQDDDLEYLRRFRPEFYNAYLEAVSEHPGDAVTAEEALRWLDGHEDQ